MRDHDSDCYCRWCREDRADNPTARHEAQSKTPRTISEYFGQPEGSFKALIQQHEASGYSPEEIALMGGITGVLKSRKEQVESLQSELNAALAQRDEARRLLGEALAALDSCENHRYSDGMLHHQTFDQTKVNPIKIDITNHLNK
jgi:hypothetical protein